MKKTNKTNKLKHLILNQIKLIIFLFISIILSILIVSFINEYIINYTEIYLLVLGAGSLSEMLVLISILLIAFYFIFNLVVTLPYLRPLRYNIYFIFLSVLLFMLIPVIVPAQISNNLGFYLARNTLPPYYSDAVDAYGILSFLIIYPLQFVFTVLITGVIFKKLKQEGGKHVKK